MPVLVCRHRLRTKMLTGLTAKQIRKSPYTLHPTVLSTPTPLNSSRSTRFAMDIRAFKAYRRELQLRYL